MTFGISLRVPALLVLFVTGACATPQTEANPFLETAPPRSPATTTPTSAIPSPTSAPLKAPPDAPSRARRAHVVRIVDGDTIVLTGIDVGETDHRTGGHKARLIGIDTPEVYGGAECLGREASAFTRDVLDGAPVLVDLDVDAIDRYGRALVYVWQMDGTFFNGRIVAEGFALPMTVPPNVRYAELFVQLARDARQAKRGLWGRC